MNYLLSYTLFIMLPFYNPVHRAVNNTGNVHPFYVSVTEINENVKEKIMEVSCKIFTDDFEKTLRMHYSNKIDLTSPPDKAIANKLIKDYISKRLSVAIDGNLQLLEYIGYEKTDEGIECYFQINNPAIQSSVTVKNNVLFEYRPEQINIIHVTVKGKRKSTQLVNPNDQKTFSF